MSIGKSHTYRRQKAAVPTIFQMRRRSSGSILVLFLVSLIPLILIIMAAFRLGIFSVAAQRSQCAAEAASLAAAQDLSRIVVNDPYYGFVALSDYEPCGKDTKAADGEPLPVLGINNVIATARLQMLIADQVNNDELRRLALQDVQAARQAARLLGDALQASITPASNYQARDLDGNIVKPYEHALQIYLTSLDGVAGSGRGRVKEFRLSLGWLKDGSNSNIKAPLPENLSAMPATARLKGNYRAFVEIPACGESFYFAGLSSQPALADVSQFVAPDGKRFCSIVKVEANLVLKGGGENKNPFPPEYVHSSACAEPYSMPDMSTPGLLALNFMHGLVPGITCMQDILDNRKFGQSNIDILTAEGGDFPIDVQAKLIQGVQSDSNQTISAAFATGLHDWLRTAHSKPRIDSVIDAIIAPFTDCAQSGSGYRQSPNLFYEFASDGRIRITNLKQSPFYEINTNGGTSASNINQALRQCVYDRQNYAFSYDAITAGGYSWMMVYRNYARTLGTVLGGKHAGQVLPGDPVNWCELARFDSDSTQASKKGKGEQALCLQANGPMYDQEAIKLDGAYFTKRDGNPLSNQPRRSQYSGGLAAYFELSSPLLPEASQS
jgi:hypothetical protein